MTRYLVFALLLLPGAAQALGVPVDENGVAESPSTLGPAAQVFIPLLIVLLMPLVLNWLTQAAWKIMFRKEAPFGLYVVSALWWALLLAVFGFFVVPAFQTLFTSFGTDLPALTRFISEQHYLLLAPAVVLPFMLYQLRGHARREFYFAVTLAGEFFLMLLCLYAMYLPVCRMEQAA